ncbi:PAS domain-containing protein [Candidatus Peregrinibacteria bacterium]|nr:PAS domain-containing protein [Candidatus Peregrinibacteria bacterium]MBT5468533.1 PAS domain-containing protein [Candidatus Peregrinibacteria bacterium]
MGIGGKNSYRRSNEWNTWYGIRTFCKDRVILDTIDHGVMTVNATGRVTDANPAALQVLKCTGKECVGFNAAEALDIRVHHKRVTKSKHPVSLVRKTKKTVQSTPDLNFSIMRADNILIPVLLVVKPLMDGKKLLGAIIVFQDVKEQRRVDYLKSEFISLASHQLRTPLSSLQWYIELLNSEGKVSKEQR